MPFLSTGVQFKTIKVNSDCGFHKIEESGTGLSCRDQFVVYSIDSHKTQLESPELWNYFPYHANLMDIFSIFPHFLN